MLSHSHISSPATTAASRVNATGVGVKRRHSLHSVKTLASYHNIGKGRKLLRVDSASSFVDRWAKMGRLESPFSREVRKLEKKGIIGREVTREGAEWFGDDERGF